MELTKEQKLQCYKGALKIIKKKSKFYGLCDCLEDELSKIIKNQIFYNYSMVLEYFPEFLAYKPMNAGEYDFWFESNEQRVEVLNNIINELTNGNNP